MIPKKFCHLVADGFEPISVLIQEGSWKNKLGWIIGPKNAVDANPIVTEDGFLLAWFDSEIQILN